MSDQKTLRDKLFRSAYFWEIPVQPCRRPSQSDLLVHNPNPRFGETRLSAAKRFRVGMVVSRSDWTGVQYVVVRITSNNMLILEGKSGNIDPRSVEIIA